MATNQYPQSLALALAMHQVEVLGPAHYDGSLASAIRVLSDERLGDGLSLASVRGTILYPAAAVLRLIEPGIQLEALALDALRTYTLRALSEGYSARTIKGKHLQLLRVLFRRFGAPDHIGELKRRMRSALAGIYVPPPRLTAPELADVFRRMAEFPGRLSARRRDIAVVRLLALRAIRTGEFARLRIERDVHLSVPCLDIAAKVKSLPRRVELSASLADDVRALIGGRTCGPLLPGGARTINALLATWKTRLHEPRLYQRHLRRSCASDLAAQGAPLPVIREVLGHAHDSPCTPRYLIGDDEQTRQALRILEHRASPYPMPGLTESKPRLAQRA